jgi:ligand-binding SRPBCC domain-containing protein
VCLLPIAPTIERILVTSHRLSRELRVAASLDEVFAFFADPRNLEQLTPPWLRFEVLTPSPITMRVGTRIDYRLRIHGLPVRWQSEISAWEPPYRFVDEQRRGPYKRWHHEHIFESIEGGTAIHDVVDYRGPGWFLEPLVNRLFIRRDVERIFAYRHQELLTRYGSFPAGI